VTSPFDTLADESRWIAWRIEMRGGKPTKVPYSPRGGMAKANDPTTWDTKAKAKARAATIINRQGNGGIGWMLGDFGSDIHAGGLDLDSCLRDGTLAPWAAAILEAVPTYAEISPSGSGIKLFFYIATADVRPFLERIGAAQDQWGIRRDVPGEDARAHGPAIEVYLSHRYFAVTERHWPSSPDRLTFLDWPALERLAGLVPPPRTTGTGRDSGGDNSRSAIAFRKGAALRRDGKTFEEMVDALRSDPETADWCRVKGMAADMRELRRIWERAAVDTGEGVSIGDFFAYMPSHSYIFAPAREMWPAASVNSRIPPVPLLDAAGNPALTEDGKPLKQKASTWLDQKKPVEQMTWAPGLPMVIHDRLTSLAGWIERKNVSCFNLYRPPLLELGDAAKADPWLEHLHKLYPDDNPHMVQWLAHRVQRPSEKINHALMLGGLQAIGKDTLLEPVKRAIGAWNWHDISPRDVLGRFNSFAKSVILRVNEARDLGDINRFQFYDHMKSYIAAPPDVLRVDEKNVREYYVFNCCGVILTTNYKTDGIYLSTDDRRHFVAWSGLVKENFSDAYWTKLWKWYENGGDSHVAAYLMHSDISGFDPKAPPPKTAAFWAIVDAGRAPEDAELADAIDLRGGPPAFVLADLLGHVSSEFADWLQDRKNRRIIPRRIETCGYVPVRNPDAKDGMWKLRARRQVIYAKDSLTYHEQLIAARDRCDGR
jgi:Family of unknown function (DUF5906)